MRDISQSKRWVPRRVTVCESAQGCPADIVLCVGPTQVSCGKRSERYAGPMSSGKRRLPLRLSLLLLLLVATLGAYRIGTTLGWQRVLVGVGVVTYLLWIVVEIRLVSIREASLPEALADRGSFEGYALAQGATTTIALLFPGSGGLPLSGLGLSLLLVGATLRSVSIIALGRCYSRRVRLLADHRLVTTGPYRWVRHPAYLGTLVGHLGLALVLGSWVGSVFWLVLFLPMVVRRILTEEPVLYRLEGYADYARRHKRLVPLVW